MTGGRASRLLCGHEKSAATYWLVRLVPDEETGALVARCGSCSLFYIRLPRVGSTHGLVWRACRQHHGLLRWRRAGRLSRAAFDPETAERVEYT